MKNISKGLERQEANRLHHQKINIPLCRLYKIAKFNKAIEDRFLAQFQ